MFKIIIEMKIENCTPRTVAIPYLLLNTTVLILIPRYYRILLSIPRQGATRSDLDLV